MTRPPLLVVHPGAELYGADRMLLESAIALSGSFPVTVALPAPGPLVAELGARGVRVEICPMPVLRNSALRPRGALRLLTDAARGLLPAWRLLRRHPGGVYVSTLTLPSWPLLARLAGRRSICHVHEAEQSAPRLLRRGMALCPALADRVVANSRFTLDVLTEVAPRLRRRATVVHNAVRGPGDVVPARPRLDGPVRLLFVGRLNPRKGPQVALAALRELAARGVDAHLTVVGDVFPGYEWFADELRATVADAGLGDRVEFLGFRADVWPYLADADVVLVPAVGDESYGNTAVEAVLAARPLVVSDHSGLREAAAGYAAAQAVPAGDPGAWADAVARVAADWSRAREAALADAGLARRRSSPERYAAELVDAVLALDPPVVPGAGLPAPPGTPGPHGTGGRAGRRVRSRRVNAPGSRLSAPAVLMYHSISTSTEPDPHRIRVHPGRLDRQLRLLRRLGLRGVSQTELLRAVDRGEASGLVGLTFDDGYADFLTTAVPVLARHGMTATVYVVAGHMGATNSWDTGPQFPIMTADQVRAVAAAGHEVGSHTMTHARLAGADPALVATEVADSRRVLEDVVQAEVPGFCYPYGAYDGAAADAVRAAGYDNACVTGDYDPGDRHTLPRCYVSPRDGRATVLARLARHGLRVRRPLPATAPAGR